ncbi:MAG: hypothetical protein MJ246_03465 [Clostridia bacterium]|nr:hypothetical protein [Clostridia bacterium]
MNDKKDVKKTDLTSVLGVILTVIGAIPAGLIIFALFAYTVFMALLSGLASSWIGSFSLDDYLEGYAELFAKIGPYWWVIVLSVIVLVIGLSMINKKEK